MSKKNCKQDCSRLGKVGGQAVMEGVMMKGKGMYAIAVRQSDSKINVVKHDFVSVREKHKVLKLPIIRGLVGFVEMMKLSFSTLTESTEMLGIEFEEEPGKFEKWLERKFGKSIISFISFVSTILGVALAMVLFMWLPAQIAFWSNSLLEYFSDYTLTNLGVTVIEGVSKIGIFVLYIVLTSLIPDIKRVYQYHGAEHKSIFCYENGEELTPENVKKQIRFHPRCGTSFIFVILILSIVVMTVVSEFLLPATVTQTLWSRILVKLVLLPVVVGIGHEFIMYAGKHTNIFTKVLSAPGLLMQRVTTKEPDLTQIEVAIVSLKTALPDAFPDYKYEPPMTEETEKTEDDNSTDKT